MLQNILQNSENFSDVFRKHLLIIVENILKIILKTDNNCNERVTMVKISTL